MATRTCESSLNLTVRTAAWQASVDFHPMQCLQDAFVSQAGDVDSLPEVCEFESQEGLLHVKGLGVTVLVEKR